MRHYLNGIEMVPENNEEIGFKANWNNSINTNDQDSRGLSLNIDTIILPREGKKIVEDWQQLNGNVIGIPYLIATDSGNAIIECYVDLMEKPIYKTYTVEVKVKRNKGFDNFYEDATGSSFQSLVDKGVEFPTFNIPYVIIPQNQVELGLTLSLSLFVFGDSLLKSIQKTAEIIADITEAPEPIPGVSIAGPTVSERIGGIINAAIKVAFQLAYTLSLFLIIIKMGEQMMELVFPKTRNFLGCKTKDLLQKSCEKLGYQFSSTLLDSLPGHTILPVPLNKSKYKGKIIKKEIFEYVQNDLDFSFNKGYPTSSDSTPTPMALIQAVEKQLNAKLKVTNGLVQLERWDYFKTLSSVDLKASLPDQENVQDVHSYNVEDIWKRYLIAYQPDYSDIYTLDNFDNTNIEYETQALNISGKQIIKGLQNMQIPFSLGSRKSGLNWVEKRAKSLLQLIDGIANTSFTSLVTDKIGNLKISQQYFTETKVLYTINGKQPDNFNDFLSPTFLWNTKHFINQIQLNGYKTKESVKIPMNDEIFVNLLDNNYADIDGKTCEIVQIEYLGVQRISNVAYKEPFDWASQHVKTVLING